MIRRDLKARGLSTKDLKDPAYEKALVNHIATAVAAEQEKDPGEDLAGVVSGIDYEIYCKTRLERSGWEVRMTPASGDQGADLIATKLGKKLVVQCKYYGQPVGNKAVQEAYAAKTFQKADFAIVVTNSTYTASAQQLAQANGVMLTHHLSLSDMDQLLGLAVQPRIANDAPSRWRDR